MIKIAVVPTFSYYIYSSVLKIANIEYVYFSGWVNNIDTFFSQETSA